MPIGDEEWASKFLRDDLGERWETDKMGHVLLHNALYQKMSPDLHYHYMNAFAGYLDKDGQRHGGYMAQRYHYDFDDMFDWNAYRRYYNGRK